MKKITGLAFIFISLFAFSQTRQSKFSVIAYYASNDKLIDNYPVEKLTHIIYSFCHLKGTRLHVNNAGDSLVIKKLVSLRKRNPSIKIILSLGGWGGCKTCSEIFADDNGRKEFASSVKELNEYFDCNGIDLDWEYPAIAGFPDHPFMPGDKQNFTSLLKTLRDTLGTRYEISFAAGGFEKFLHESVEWDKIEPYIDKVNLMSYDLVHGNSKVSGHHTALYSTPRQVQSADNAIRFFDSIHFPLNKIVIGAAMYGRVFEVSNNALNGLYQPAVFKNSISWKNVDEKTMKKEGYHFYWDDEAQAPYMFNKKEKKLFTYENNKSIDLKTAYALQKGLNGIMFWQLAEDKSTNGLLDEIDKVIKR